uniref:Uncharacterized protein n=1 Tax=Arundo donax TaxID=35708 RepID=A0A0A9FS17_ARUDO
MKARSVRENGNLPEQRREAAEVRMKIKVMFSPKIACRKWVSSFGAVCR